MKVWVMNFSDADRGTEKVIGTFTNLENAQNWLETNYHIEIYYMRDSDSILFFDTAHNWFTGFSIKDFELDSANLI